MEKKLSVFYNVNFPGGAEKSLTTSLEKFLNEKDYEIFVPQYGNSIDKLSPYIQKIMPDVVTKKISLPMSYMELSRSSHKIIFLSQLLVGVISFLFFTPLKVSSRRIYVNGNKIAPLIYLKSLLNFRLTKFYWHFRDYPNNAIMNLLIKLLLLLPKPFQFSFICSSHSVANELRKKVSGKYDIQVIYNYVNQPKADRQVNTRKKINLGFVGMFAPWKGIHNIIKFASEFEDELKNLNIGKILIYGDEIYQSTGHHQGHKEELHSLKQKLNATLISFEGMKDTEEIYKNIDILLHTSNKPEPFGRIIVEAYSNGIPVLSTSLGGSSELIYSPHKDCVLDLNNRSNWIKSIEKILLSDISPRELKDHYTALSKLSAEQHKSFFSL